MEDNVKKKFFCHLGATPNLKKKMENCTFCVQRRGALSTLCWHHVARGKVESACSLPIEFRAHQEEFWGERNLIVTRRQEFYLVVSHSDTRRVAHYNKRRLFRPLESQPPNSGSIPHRNFRCFQRTAKCQNEGWKSLKHFMSFLLQANVVSYILWKAYSKWTREGGRGGKKFF